MRLSLKMILFNLLGKGLILLVFFLAGPTLLRQLAIEYTDHRLMDKKMSVMGIIENEGIGSFIEEGSDEGYGSYNLFKEEYISLEKIEGASPQDTIYNEGRKIDQDIVSYRVLSSTFPHKGSTYLLEIGRSLETINEMGKQLNSYILIAFLLFVLISILLDGVFHNYILKPFYRIIRTKLSEINDPLSSTQAPIHTSTLDFKLLDKAIDDMMVRIQHAFNRERQFIAHASHELMTPISILQSKVENILGEYNDYDPAVPRFVDALNTIHRLKHIIRSLLFISKIGNAQYIKTDPIDLQGITKEIFEEWHPIAQDKNITLTYSSEPQVLAGDSNQSLVYMMIQNAVKNAIYYTPSGGQVSIVAKTEGYAKVVKVTDNGPGIPDELLLQVKKGIVFLNDAKSEKSGFGLLIMHRIAEYVQAKLTIKTSPYGTEITFTMGT